jgi:hypothetical protein
MFKGDFRISIFRLGVRFLRGCGVAALAIGAGVVAMGASPPQSGPAKDGEPAWFIYQPPPPAAGGPGGGPRPVQPIAACAADSAKLNVTGPNERVMLMARWKEVSPACQDALAMSVSAIDLSDIPTCVKSVICLSNNGQGISWRPNPGGLHGGSSNIKRVQWRSDPVNLGYTPSYPYTLIPGANGAVSVAVDSRDNLWVLQRAPVGTDALSKFDAKGKLLFTRGDKVLGHLNKAHGIAIDAQDNVWIADPGSSIIMQISPDGKLLKTIGERGKRGDWDEEKGQRLLWQPISIAFDPRNGDMYIGEGHGAESPNDRDSGVPWNTSGAARVIRLDKNGKFISQLYGNMSGTGKFYQVHDLAIDPTNGDLWIGDREDYRMVVYDNQGEFIKTIQMRNLICNIAFDKNGDLWVGTGLDGQFLKLNRDGKILGAIGNGPGGGEGQIGETGYIRWDSKGNLITGSTTQARVTVWTAPKNK